LFTCTLPAATASLCQWSSCRSASTSSGGSSTTTTFWRFSVEFGTILIYTCEKSCWPQNHQTPMEEFCIIQEDPDELLFK
uniref:Programmed cell death 2 like n=1 Tax=Equus asinus TaxID=9793 RepID=A0A8C4MTS1_EQUAS